MESNDVDIEVERATLTGTFTAPMGTHGVVVFAHGSGSSRFSKRNTFVAGVLNNAGFSTLLLDLLTRDEERIDNVTGDLRFDISLLAERVVAAIDWVKADPDVGRLPIGLFGASTGAAAALVAAAARQELVDAIVSRGGRPDLAAEALPLVRAPTLLIVGGHDVDVLALNRDARARLACKSELAIVPGATHLFEEEGALEHVAALAEQWFTRFLVEATRHAPLGAP